MVSEKQRINYEEATAPRQSFPRPEKRASLEQKKSSKGHRRSRLGRGGEAKVKAGALLQFTGASEDQRRTLRAFEPPEFIAAAGAQGHVVVIQRFGREDFFS